MVGQPVEVDVDLVMIAVSVYFLLRVGEYTWTGSSMLEKQTEQFKMKDATFFSMDDHSKIRQMSRLAPNEEIMGAQIGTLTLGNEKNGWKGRALGLRYWRHMTTSLLHNAAAKDMSGSLKKRLECSIIRGSTPIP
jgi:hypothetical protein